MRHVVGLVPAAGSASRLGRLPCSKEIFPVAPGDAARPRVACDYLLEGFRTAGIRRALILLRKGKWDVPALLGDGSDFGLPLAYLAFEPTACVPETLDRAYPFIAEATVALGFPDIVVEPGDAFRSLIRRRRQTGAEVVLGLFPTDQSWKCDMVELDGGISRPGRAPVELSRPGRAPVEHVRRIVIKQAQTALRFTWSIAVWGPEFSRFLHDFVAAERAASATETYVGDVIQAAIDDGMEVIGERFDEGSFLDVGTPEDLRRAAARFAPREEA